MGNACCVAARDKMVIPNSSSSIGVENLRNRRSYNNNNNLRHSPNWSFRWDTNRGRVAGEETSLSWLSSDGISRSNDDDGSEFKFESAFVSNASSDGSPSLDSFRTHHTLQKSPASELSFARNSSMDTVFEQKENESATQLSLSLPSQPSSSPLSSQSYLNPSSSSTTLKPIQQQQQQPRLSETDSSSEKDWSLQAFSELMSSSRNDKNRISSSSCGACSRPLTERSLWNNNNNNNQKMFVTSNELSVSAILACGHVYHGECLEEMTLEETDKFDPLCPVCTLGEKKTTMKLSEKVKQNKRVRNRVLDDDFVMFDDREMGKSPKVFESSSAKQPFLARRFSFGSRSNCKSTTQENHSVRKKGFFWTKSSKI